MKVQEAPVESKSVKEGKIRLPESKIREALVRPEKLVREEALFYFAECYSQDAEVMPLAIQAIQTFGRRNAFLPVHMLAELVQTDATVEWAIQELHREEDRAEDHDGYFPGLSRLLCHADPQLLVPRAKEILQAPGFSKRRVPEFQECLRLAAWDADKCWSELEAICAGGTGKRHASDVDFGHASRVVEALARNGGKYAGRILDLLGHKVEDFENDPMTWMEIFLVMLAGEMRLEPAIPLIVKKLHECGEVLSEQCVEALGKIGTDAAAEAVTDGWLDSVWDYRLYATSALEKIHSDTTLRKCLELLPQDKDHDIRTKLADAVLSQFAEAAVEPIREIVQRQDYDPTDSDLMRRLVAVSTVLGVTFPEYPVWKREAEERRARQEEKMREASRFFRLPLPKEPKPVERKPAPAVRADKKVGRNDPCPCGSGKKFKKCCLNKKSLI